MELLRLCITLLVAFYGQFNGILSFRIKMMRIAGNCLGLLSELTAHIKDNNPLREIGINSQRLSPNDSLFFFETES